MGVGISHRVLKNPADAALVKKHFQILTPENCMKPQPIQPAEGKWNFKRTDEFMDFVRTHKMEAVGHCLV